MVILGFLSVEFEPRPNWNRVFSFFSSFSFSSFFLVVGVVLQQANLLRDFRHYDCSLSCMTLTSMWTTHPTGLLVHSYLSPITVFPIPPWPPMTVKSPKSVIQTSHCMTKASSSSWLLIQLFPLWLFFFFYLISNSNILIPYISLNQLFFFPILVQLTWHDSSFQHFLTAPNSLVPLIFFFFFCCPCLVKP